MTQKEHHTQNNTDRTSYSFQTLNMTMQDKPDSQSTMNKVLMSILNTLQRIHWFTLLLILIVGWSSYQMVRRSPSKYQWIQEGVQHAKQWANTIKPPTPSRPPIAAQSTTPPKAIIVKEVISPPQPPVIEQEKSKLPQQSPRVLQEDNSMQKVEQRLVHMETSVKQLNLQMAALQRNARALDSQIRRLNQNITMLSSISAEASRATQATASSNASSPTASTDKTASQSKPKDKTESDYSLHAVIPGRAWLNTPDGKIITVSVGSPLPQYGHIQAIDSAQGVVYCSTGAAIKFSTQEY